MSERHTTILATIVGVSAMLALAVVRPTETKAAISDTLWAIICLIAFIHYQLPVDRPLRN
jgi:hypothetical protein